MYRQGQAFIPESEFWPEANLFRTLFRSIPEYSGLYSGIFQNFSDMFGNELGRLRPANAANAPPKDASSPAGASSRNEP